MSQPSVISVDKITADSDVILVDGSKSPVGLGLREVWGSRDLFLILAIRDIKVRYRQTVVGIAWTVLQPLGQMFAFSVLKQMLVTSPEAGHVPDDVSMFCGLLLYQLF